AVERAARRSSASRYPPSPWRSQCATRVTVVVDAPVRLLTSRYGRPRSSSLAASQRGAIPSSSLRLQRSRRKRSVSDRDFSLAIALQRSLISLVRHVCRGSVAMSFSMLACCHGIMEVIPAIDLLGDEAVRLRQGDFDQVVLRGSPLELARRFAAGGARLV